MSFTFGTDGVRGVANVELTPAHALALGAAVVDAFEADTVVLGVDTRRSGPMLAAAVSAGVASAGADVVELEVIPTPAVAREARIRGCPGVMISASHNPFADNGLKVFGPGGQKLSDAVQQRIESSVRSLVETGAIVGEDGRPRPRPSGADLGVIEWDSEAASTYVDSLVAAAGGDGALDGLSVVIDAANGAGTVVGPKTLRRLGATVHVIGAQPDGININDGVGSTDLTALSEAVLHHGADVGVALDGDADRCLAVDEQGNHLDGDRIIAMCALDLHRRGMLEQGGVVVTVMSNLGFRKAMEAAGIRVVVTPVGDRFVVDAMARERFILGGEQSGHVVFADTATTGDGVLTAVRLLRTLFDARVPLSELAERSMTRLPQHLLNVRVAQRPTDLFERVTPAVERIEALLGDDGRVLIRPSGTEPLVRVMVEAPTSELAERCAAELADEVRRVAEAG